MHFAYINTETMEYPVHEGDIRLLYPEIDIALTGETFPIIMPFAPVYWNPPPTFDALTQATVQTTPELINGQWQVKWAIRELSDAEKAEIAEMLADKQRDDEPTNA